MSSLGVGAAAIDRVEEQSFDIPIAFIAEDEELDNRRQALGEALAVLDSRERRIFEARRLAERPITLGELAKEFGVSRERVRQIEVRAFEKVGKGVRHRMAALERLEAHAAH